MNRACSTADPKKFKKVSHVIFDMDGVLLDTETLYTKATQNIVSKYGKTYNWTIKTQLMGLTGAESAKRIVAILDLPITAEEYYKLAQEEYAVIMTQAALMPGAETLVKHLHKHNIPIAVATSSAKDSFELKTAKYKDFFNLFSHIVTGGSDPEVKQGKPQPDIFLICAQRFAKPPRPEDCLVFEDAPNGVTAAVNAGMQVVMIPDENVPIELQKDADLVIQALDKIDLSLFGLPPMNCS